MKCRLHITIFLALLVVGMIPAHTAPPELYAQSAATLLNRRFSDTNISYLLLDAHTGALLASRWPQPDQPVPVGSLIKPFTALAYGESHAFKFPEHVCSGKQCWLPHGHGRLDLSAAIAYSCNSYFRSLAAGLSPGALARVLDDLGLPALPHLTSAAFVGFGDDWTVPPLALARAYAALAARSDQDGVRPILAGMQMSAREGTGKAIGAALAGSPALAKTGTAPCVHGTAPGDGYSVTLYPADSPRLLLLVRVHGTPGSHAAITAGQMLHALLETN